MLQRFGLSRKKKAAKSSAVPVVSNPVLAITVPSSLAASTSQDATSTLPRPSHISSFDATLDLAITACKTVEKIGEILPDAAAGPIKGTFGILTLVLETVKCCRDNREGWRLLAEIIIEKNKRVESLLQLYAKAPVDYPNALEQAVNYQRMLNIITIDMKKETEKPSEAAQGIALYWLRMKSAGREAALSNINAARIASYQDRLRTITLDIVEEIVLRIAIETHSIAKKLGDQIKWSAPMVSLKPRPLVVEDFVGREDILNSMCATHFGDQSTPRTRPTITVLTGMGGSGKTQIAVKFASQFEERFPDVPVYFLNASSNASLEVDLKTLMGSQTASYEDALIWLATQVPNWLLIMDNADNPLLDPSQYVPRTPRGHIIITTRNEIHKGLASRSAHVIDALPLEESIALLLHSSNCEENDANRLLAKDLVEEVGQLPLAIAHAAAYIRSRGRLGAYLEMYRKSQLTFLNKRPPHMYDYPHSVAGTIQISYDCLSLEAQQLLQLLSYLDIQSIPRCIIEKAAAQGFNHVAGETELPLNPATIGHADALRSLFCPEGEWDDSRFDDTVEECLRYSLLRSTVVGEIYSMHPLVQTYLHFASSSVQGYPPRRLVTRLLASSITRDTDGRHVTAHRLLLPHIRLIAMEDVTEAGDHLSLGDILMYFGDELAIAHLQQCLNMWRRILGEDHNDTLVAMMMLASAHLSLGRAGEALPFFEDVLEKQRKQLGPDDPATLMAMSNLTKTYRLLGREVDALPLQEEVLEKWRKLLGPDHLDTLMAMNNLALTYQSLGRSADALQLLEEVLEKRRRLLGPDNPNTLLAMTNLAVVYQSLGRASDALQLQEEVLEKWRELLGPDHLDTLMAMNNLAAAYQSLGRASDALPLHEEVLEKRRKLLGPDHFDTLMAMDNLGLTYQSLGRSTDALPLQEEVLGKRLKLLGPDHLSTLNTMNNLAYAYQSLGRASDALPLQEEVLEKRRKLLGPDHLDTLSAMNNLGLTYQSLGRSTDALPLFEEVLVKWRKLLGPNHLNTLTAMNNLALTYQSLGRSTDALPLQEEALEKWKKLLGPDHLSSLTTTNNLALTYQSLGRSSEALPLFEEVLEKWRKLLGPDHLDTLTAMNNLALTYHSLGRSSDALPLFEEVLEKWRKLLEPDHLSILKVMNNLAATYQSIGKASDALPLQEEVLEKLRRLLGPDHHDTVVSMLNLLLSYDSLKMDAKMKELGRTALPLLQKVYGEDHEWTILAKKKMERFYA